MASLRRIEANRRNGSKGGPKTAEGKLRSRANALTHGLCAQTIQVMPDEDPEEWNRVRETIVGTSEISDGIQLAVVEQLALNHWRSMRLRRHEIRLLDLHAGAQMETAKRYPNGEVVEEDYEGGVAVALINSQEKQWTKFFRYDAAISCDFNRSVQQYVSLRKLPQPAEPLAAAAVSENGTPDRVAPGGSVPSIEPVGQTLPSASGLQPAALPPSERVSSSTNSHASDLPPLSENGIPDRVAPGGSVSSTAPSSTNSHASDLLTSRSSDLPPRRQHDRIPNGVRFSADQSLLLVADSRNKWVRSVQVQPDGSLANGQAFLPAGNARRVRR